MAESFQRLVSARRENITVAQETGRETGSRRRQRVTNHPGTRVGIEDLCDASDISAARGTHHTTRNHHPAVGQQHLCMRTVGLIERARKTPGTSSRIIYFTLPNETGHGWRSASNRKHSVIV